MPVSNKCSSISIKIIGFGGAIIGYESPLISIEKASPNGMELKHHTFGKTLDNKNYDWYSPVPLPNDFDFMTNDYRIFLKHRLLNEEKEEAVAVSSSSYQEVPKGADGQAEHSPRSEFFKNIFKQGMRDNYEFFDENHNSLGAIDDIGHDPETRNDSYFFHNGNQMKGQMDVIYYKSITGGRKRKGKTVKRRGHRSRRNKSYKNRH